MKITLTKSQFDLLLNAVQDGLMTPAEALEQAQGRDSSGRYWPVFSPIPGHGGLWVLTLEGVRNLAKQLQDIEKKVEKESQGEWGPK